MRSAPTIHGPLARAAIAWSSLLAVAAPGCTTRDCPEQRAGEVRCIGNRLETCHADGSLTYEPCTPEGLVCSERHRGCVTEEALTGDGGAGGAGGANGGSAGG